MSRFRTRNTIAQRRARKIVWGLAILAGGFASYLNRFKPGTRVLLTRAQVPGDAVGRAGVIIAKPDPLHAQILWDGDATASPTPYNVTGLRRQQTP